MWILIAIALSMGALVPVQTAANARMRAAAGTAVVVTLISFTVSTLLLAAISAAAGIPLVPSAEQAANVPWWGWTGGILALATITATICLFRELGQLQTAILPLLGQLSFSLVIDHFGLFGSVRIPLSAARAVAVLLLIAGVALVVVVPNHGKRKAEKFAPSARLVFWQLTGIAAGCLMASIGAIYGALGTRLGSAVQASTVSFIIATLAIAAVCTATGKIGRARKVFAKGHPLWMWLGGACGAAAVFGNAWLIPLVGAGAFFMAYLLGQMSLSLLMEWRGWMGADRKNISLLQLAGIALMLAGVAMIRLN